MLIFWYFIISFLVSSAVYAGVDFSMAAPSPALINKMNEQSTLNLRSYVSDVLNSFDRSPIYGEAYGLVKADTLIRMTRKSIEANNYMAVYHAVELIKIFLDKNKRLYSTDFGRTFDRNYKDILNEVDSLRDHAQVGCEMYAGSRPIN